MNEPDEQYLSKKLQLIKKKTKNKIQQKKNMEFTQDESSNKNIVTSSQSPMSTISIYEENEIITKPQQQQYEDNDIHNNRNNKNIGQVIIQALKETDSNNVEILFEVAVKMTIVPIQDTHQVSRP